MTREEGNLLWPEMLGVLDPEPTIPVSILRRHLRIEVENLAIGPIANRVDGNLQSGSIRSAQVGKHARDRNHLLARQPTGCRLVEVRSEEERRGRAEGAIRKAFEPPDAQAISAKMGAQSDPRQSLPLAERLVGIDPHRQLILLQEALVRAKHRRRGRHIVHARHPLPRSVGQRRADRDQDLLLGGGGNDPGDE